SVRRHARRHLAPAARIREPRGVRAAAHRGRGRDRARAGIARSRRGRLSADRPGDRGTVECGGAVEQPGRDPRPAEMTARLLIYGANGYTGEMIARAAAAQGLSPVLAGRSAEG